MKSRILIAGGYGLIGSYIAQHLRKMSSDTELILAGRSPEKGEKLAKDLGGASTAYLDIKKPDSLENLDLDQLDLIIASLHDPSDLLVRAAMKHRIGYIDITKLVGDVAVFLYTALQSPLDRPIALLGHTDAGINAIVTKHVAADFKKIDSVKIASLYDVHDPIGPNTGIGNDARYPLDRALLYENGRWAWVNARSHARKIQISKDQAEIGIPGPLPDVPSVVAVTGANHVRWDSMRGDSFGTKAGKKPSHEVYIDIEGTLHSGEYTKRRTVVSDPNGQAHLTALGVLLVAEQILGLDGPPAKGGVYFPEALVPTEVAMERLKQFGVHISHS
ncbi:saccharopine dehydrogenase NADP-binding domain-containing protein [Shimazuella kribbensis]|uniref:saccharopine dehydrogenase NADP-binding domain-containing protein n=1 Tax=Shimazuella kribbensis TaxID=139808 RepID=UPI0003FE635D|nr:saccharopine dehydrogenase NADP-binding domain-containing protein [Shimazuella kribbensis]